MQAHAQANVRFLGYAELPIPDMDAEERKVEEICFFSGPPGFLSGFARVSSFLATASPRVDEDEISTKIFKQPENTNKLTRVCPQNTRPETIKKNLKLYKLISKPLFVGA